MEYWESKADDGLILYTDPCTFIRIDPVPLNAGLQHSNIPLPHHSATANSKIHGTDESL